MTVTTDPLRAVFAQILEYREGLKRLGRAGSVEIVFGPGGEPTHVHERQTVHLRAKA